MSEILKQSHRDSQFITLEINTLKQHLETLNKNIENKLEAINK